MRLNEDALDDLVVLVQGTSLPVFAPTSPLSTFTVNVTTDTSDVFPGNGICADSVNKCSLRAAIQESNSRAGADTIQFNIGTGTPTTSPTSPLPDIIDTVTINGATGGATRVQLSGASAGAGATGLYFDEGFSSTGNNSLVRSLVINRFGGTGISILTSNNRIEDCYIGTDASGGSSVAGNGDDGIHILSPTFFGRLNTIGGTAASQRNVISHNSGNGVLLDNDADTNTIAGNYIGTDASGTAANPNSGDGVVVVTDAISNTIGGAASAPGTPPGNVISGNSGNGVKTVGVASANSIQGNLIGTRADGTAALGNSLNGVLTTDGEHGDTIGGTSPSSRNVISGNAGDGVEFNGAGSGGSLRGNFIGTDISGAAAVPNGGHGVLVTAGATGSIGGTSSLTPGACTGDCNLIAFNTGAGVRVDSASSLNVAIRGNSLFANSGLGIDLGPTGVTANDPSDADTGANTLQNFPVLTSAAFGGASTTIKGTLNSTANTTFTVELYDNASADPSGNGEGKTYLGSTTVTTNASGDGQFTFVASGNPSFLTATATSPDGNTSEFSAGYSNPGEASAAGTLKAVKSVGTAVTHRPARPPITPSIEPPPAPLPFPARSTGRTPPAAWAYPAAHPSTRGTRRRGSSSTSSSSDRPVRARVPTGGLRRGSNDRKRPGSELAIGPRCSRWSAPDSSDIASPGVISSLALLRNTPSGAPEACNHGPAAGAGSLCGEAVVRDVIAGAPDHKLSAARAARVLEVSDPPGQVPRIHIAQPRLLADLGRAHQVPGRRVRVLRHLVVLMEGRHVPRGIRRDGDQEAGNVRQLFLRVIETGHEERDDLDPEPQLAQQADRVEDVLEPPAQLPVVLLAEALEIHFVEVNVRADVAEDLGRPVAVGDIAAGDSFRLRSGEHLHGPLARDEGFVVGADHHGRPAAFRDGDDLLRLDIPRWGESLAVAQRLGGQPVLAVGTMVIAAQHPEGERDGAGEGVEERLLFDRIHLQARHVASRDVEDAIPVVADSADAVEAVGDHAAVAAGIAADLPPVQLLVESPESPLDRASFEGAVQGRDGRVLLPCHGCLARFPPAGPLAE